MKEIEIIETQVVFTDFEKSEYSRLKAQAKQGWLLFAEAIVKIRDSKLYKIEYNTFEEFCGVELGISDRHAQRLMQSADIIESLKGDPWVGLLPNSERQARPLTKLEPELQIRAWAEVVSENPKENITAKVISEKVDEYKSLNIELREDKQEITKQVLSTSILKSEADIQAEIDRKASEKAKELLKAFEEEKERKKQEKKETRIAEINKQISQIENGELPKLSGLFSAISIDPPWAYSEKGGFSAAEHDDENNRGGVAYPTMTVAQIKEIDLPLMPDSVVFLWTTHAFLRDAFDILETWGLNYKATIVWDKEIMGMGRNIRMQCEFCLLATKGSPLIQGSAERDIIRAKRREHSRKPDEFFAMVDRMIIGKKLEYFSREARQNWEVFGNDTNKF